MQKKRLGKSEVSVSPIGLGCWGMSHAYGHADRNESIATIKLAVDMGISLLDTADIYGNGENEKLVGEAIRGIRSEVIISSKFGFRGNEHGELEVCGKPEYVKQACEASLKRLNVETIDIYHLHRVDPKISISETVGAMAGLIKEGKVRALGLSEVSGKTLREACGNHYIAALQSEYSLFTKDIEIDILPVCREVTTDVLAFSPLGRGFLAGRIVDDKQLENGDYRKNLPRFTSENLRKNLVILEEVKKVAADKGVTLSQLALTWLLHQGPGMIPIVGMKRPKYLVENLAAVQIALSNSEVALLRTITAEVSGSRHNDNNLKFIDQ